MLGLAAACAHAGPPFLTDDPEPVDRHHAEFNAIWQQSRDRGGRAGTLGVELNVGCAAETQCHVAVPAAFYRPADGPSRAGLGDAELGVKYRFVDDADAGWSAAVYPTMTLPTGDPSRGLGNGRPQWLLPLWVQRRAGPWQWDAGVSWLGNDARGARGSWFTGLLAQRALGERLSLGAEVYRRTSQAVGDPSAAGVDVGAIVAVAPHANVLASLGRGLGAGADRRSLFLACQLEL
jgi:hypothetical protein